MQFYRDFNWFYHLQNMFTDESGQNVVFHGLLVHKYRFPRVPGSELLSSNTEVMFRCVVFSFCQNWWNSWPGPNPWDRKTITSEDKLFHGTYIRWYFINRCARTEKYLLFDLFQASFLHACASDSELPKNKNYQISTKIYNFIYSLNKYLLPAYKEETSLNQ